MAYDLGVDVGTSYSAAAIRRPGGAIEVAGLGAISDSVPSVVYLDADGSMIIGDAANRRSVIDPTGAAREFKRRMGDPTPLILRSSPFSAESLMARVMRYVVDKVAEREHDQPRHVTFTHPANWGPYKLELFDQAFRLAGLEGATALSEPAAAAHSYASEARVPVGSVMAVYDLGGGTFDAAVLRKEADAFTQLGDSVGIEHLGGVDFDEAIFHHVRSLVGDAWPTDPDDPELPAPMLHLRRSCMEAKELLSSEQTAQIPVMLPGVDTTVTVTREEFEAMIAPRVGESISALQAALASANVTPSDLHAVLLVGGSSRIPLVARMLKENVGDLVATDVDPLYAVARGAAVMAGIRGDLADGGAPAAVPIAVAPEPASPAPAPAPAAPAAVAPAPVAPAAAAPVVAAPAPVEPPAPAQPATPAPPPVSAPAPTAPPPTPAAPAQPEPVQAAQPAAPAPAQQAPTPAAPAAAAQFAPPAGPGRAADTPNGPRTPDPGAFRPAGSDSSGGGGKGKMLVGLLGVVALLAAIGVGFVLTRGDGQVATDDEATATTTVEPDADAPAAATALASPEGMVTVPAGTFTLGVDKPEPNNAESLTSTQDLPAFLIDQNEVTNEGYKTFVDQQDALEPLSWPGSRYPDALANHPVKGVSHDWANAFCVSLGKRLPTEAEWEASARGTEAFLYPWGNDASTVTIPTGDPYEVGTLVGNTSPFGVNDLIGNVWEWVGESYDNRVDDSLRVLRGGQNGYIRKAVTRLPVDPQRSNALSLAGFRCAADEAGVDPSVAELTFGEFERPVGDMAPEPIELAEGVLISDEFDDSTSGWLETSTEIKRFGYHPNGFYHLELKAVDQEVMAPAPLALSGAPFSIGTSVFVDDANTEPGGTFRYGLAFNWDETGRGLVFIVDPFESQWLLCNRNEDGSYEVISSASRNIPLYDDVALEARYLGDDQYEFLIGGNVVNRPKIPGYAGSRSGLVMLSYGAQSFTKSHTHFNFFELSEN